MADAADPDPRKFDRRRRRDEAPPTPRRDPENPRGFPAGHLSGPATLHIVWDV